MRLAVWPPARSYWRALCQPSPVLSSQPARRPQRLSDRMGAKGDRGRAVPGRSAHAWPARPSASSYLQPWQSSRAYFALSCFACARAGRRRRDGDAAVAAAAAAIVVGRALAASAPASLAASACTRADSCRQHMCVRACVCASSPPPARSPIAHRPPIHHPSPGLAARTRGSQCNRRPPAAPSSLLSPHPQSLSAPARVSGPVR